jgi:hypothetical protein
VSSAPARGLGAPNLAGVYEARFRRATRGRAGAAEPVVEHLTARGEAPCSTRRGFCASSLPRTTCRERRSVAGGSGTRPGLGVRRCSTSRDSFPSRSAGDLADTGTPVPCSPHFTGCVWSRVRRSDRDPCNLPLHDLRPILRAPALKRCRRVSLGVESGAVSGSRGSLEATVSGRCHLRESPHSERRHLGSRRLSVNEWNTEVA